MDLHSGEPVWITGARPLNASPLDRDLQCDVAVVGGGITGALVSDALMREGLHVVLVEDGRLAMGSTAASTALVLYELDVPLFELERRIGHERAHRAYHIGIEAIDELERLCADLPACAFRRRQSVHFTRRAGAVRDLRFELAARQGAGLTVHWADPETLRTRWGLRAAGAVVSDAGAELDPYQLTRSLLRRCMSHGVEVYDRTRVKGVTSEARGVTLRTSGGATIQAGHCVLATGYESQDYLPERVAELRSTYVIAVRPDAPAPGPGAVFWERADPYLYARWLDDGRMLLGGEDEEFVDSVARDALMPTKARTLLERAKEIMPDRRWTLERTWCGTFASTEDGLGYAGEAPSMAHTVFLLGFGGNGITLSMAGTGIVVDHILGRTNADAPLFAFGRG